MVIKMILNHWVAGIGYEITMPELEINDVFDRKFDPQYDLSDYETTLCFEDDYWLNVEILW